MYFYCYVYKFLLLCLCILLLCVFCSVYSVSLSCSAYCLYVNVYCTTATECQPNCSQQIYHIIYYCAQNISWISTYQQCIQIFKNILLYQIWQINCCFNYMCALLLHINPRSRLFGDWSLFELKQTNINVKRMYPRRNKTSTGLV
jgi:hypothetical protein